MSTEERHCWRHDESKLPPRPRHNGISAKEFHNISRNRRPRELDKLLKESANNVVRQQRKQVSSHNKLRRAAFKEVTSLKTWPLQELAMQDLDQLCMVYLGKNHPRKTDLENESDVECHGDSTGLSSSSLDEPKRTRRRDSDDEENLSPRKSTLRHQYMQEFIRERDIAAFDNEESTCLPALWCMEPRIFAFEKSATGKRRYIVGQLGRFMDYYWRKCDLKQRHFYEVIREKTPCRLYFDLEFSKISNRQISDTDGVHLLEELMQELFHEFKRIYDMELTRDRIVELDSSTESKFSFHWIVHLPNDALFADTVAAGRFVRVFVGRLTEEMVTGCTQRSTLAKYLFVEPASPKTRDEHNQTPFASKSCLVDLGVYTRNRLFRILGSSKFGKPASAALHLSSSNTFPLPIGNERFFAPAFKEKDESKIDNDLGDNVKDDLQSFQSSVDWTCHASALSATLVVPMNVMKKKYIILEESEEAKALLADADGVSPLNSLTGSIMTRPKTTAIKSGNSPFPLLDNFVITNLARRGGIQGSIRGWCLQKEGNLPKCITYHMAGNRWCEAIGRQHKSNNIMWTIDFTCMGIIQSCHDPECRAHRFRCPPKPLPDALQNEIRDILFDYELMSHADEAEELIRTRSAIPAPAAETEFDSREEKAPSSQDEFDDAEFEKALMALSIKDDHLLSSAECPTKESKNHVG